jgi:ribosomal protein S18 acetylase RimI-like enzyme
MQGFSTFACKPLINIHDLAVLSGYRGKRIAERMLTLVETVARERGACKLTLEVLSGNVPAMKLYARVGFAQYALDPAAGQAAFMQKWLE